MLVIGPAMERITQNQITQDLAEFDELLGFEITADMLTAIKGLYLKACEGKNGTPDALHPNWGISEHDAYWRAIRDIANIIEIGE